jgi:hypothetical protein
MDTLEKKRKLIDSYRHNRHVIVVPLIVRTQLHYMRKTLYCKTISQILGGVGQRMKLSHGVLLRMFSHEVHFSITRNIVEPYVDILWSSSSFGAGPQ